MNAPLTALQALLMSQEKRIFKLKFPHNDGPSSSVFLENFDGVEAMNSAFAYTLKLISEDGRIELKDFMGKMATVELDQANSSEPRYFNGYITAARHAGSDGGLSFYELTLSPWTKLLEHRRDHYIFHNQTQVATLEELFADYGPFNDHKFIVANPGPQETFRVQYDESDANYFNRRCEEKGWSYWFEHRLDGHTLVISDDTTTQAGAIEPIAQVRFQGGNVKESVDSIDQWNGARTLQPSKVAVQSFDFKQPTFPLYSEQATNRVQGAKVLPMEVFEYTGALAFANIGAGNDLAALRLEEFEARAKSFQGAGNHRALTTGRYFELTEHFEHDASEDSIEREFLITGLSHSGSNNYLQKGVDAVYRNTFSTLRRGVPWRPARNANSAPVAAPGIQTATVVGPAGEEIHCDEFGRVKVQFHWDRAGTMDDKSSCWVRVSSPWAGTNYGGIQLPRIGQEVIVDFLNGNVDQPIIVGRTYNQGQMPPWSLPAQKNQSGFYSKSIGGGYDNANVLRFDDTAQAEELWLHAEKNQLTEVENDEKKWVGNDRVKTIDRDETSLIKRDRTETVNHDETITVNNDRTERVDHNEKISIGDNRTEDVGIDETISIGKNRTETVGSNETISIGSNRKETVGSNEDVSIGKNRSKTIGSNEKDKIGKNWSINVGKMKTETIGMVSMQNVGMARMDNVGMAYSLNVGMLMNTLVGVSQITKVGKTISVSAGDKIEFTCGDSKFTMTPDAIYLETKDLHIKTTNKVHVDGPADVLLNSGTAKCAPGNEEKKEGAGAAGGAPVGASGFAAGAGSGPPTAALMGALEKGSGVFGMINSVASLVQQGVGLVGMGKQVAGLFSKDKGGSSAAAATAVAAAPAASPAAPAAAKAAASAPVSTASPAQVKLSAPAVVPAAPENFRGMPAISQSLAAVQATTSTQLSDEALGQLAQQTVPEQAKAAAKTIGDMDGMGQLGGNTKL
jgi:type VI secretion system secreted protein VgrG